MRNDGDIEKKIGEMDVDLGTFFMLSVRAKDRMKIQ